MKSSLHQQPFNFHPDPEISGGPGLQRISFRPLGPQFGLKISRGGGGAGPLGPSPGSAAASLKTIKKY